MAASGVADDERRRRRGGSRDAGTRHGRSAGDDGRDDVVERRGPASPASEPAGSPVPDVEACPTSGRNIAGDLPHQPPSVRPPPEATVQQHHEWDRFMRCGSAIGSPQRRALTALWAVRQCLGASAPQVVESAHDRLADHALATNRSRLRLTRWRSCRPGRRPMQRSTRSAIARPSGPSNNVCTT